MILQKGCLLRLFSAALFSVFRFGSHITPTHVGCVQSQQSLIRCECRHQIWVSLKGDVSRQMQATTSEWGIKVTNWKQNKQPPWKSTTWQDGIRVSDIF